MAMTLSGRVLVAVTRPRGALPHIAKDVLLSRRDRLSTSSSPKAYVAYAECTSHVCSPYPAWPSSHLGHPRHPYDHPSDHHYLKTHTLWAPPHSAALLTRSLHVSTARFHDSRPSGEQPPDPPSSSSPPEALDRAPVPRRPMYRRVVDEVKHYYHGFRQLAIDTRVAGAMVWRLLQGKALTRREKIRLRSTCADLFRLVPFVPFVIVPFMELLLPVFIKLFPSMLPSTFETLSDKEQKRSQAAAVKQEVAHFLRETFQLERRRRNNGQHHAPGEEETEALTLENLERPQLMALCRMLELRPIGTNNLLRSRLLAQLARIRADDEVIVAEGGPAALDVEELEVACHHRGMPSAGLTSEELRQQLQRWLDLHLNENVPSPMLLLTRALSLTEPTTPGPKLKNGGHPHPPPPHPGSTEGSGDAPAAASAAAIDVLADPAPIIKDRSQSEAVRDRAPSLQAGDKPLSPAEVLVAKEATDAAQKSKSNSNGV